LIPTYGSVVSSVTLCRDEKDNFLLSLARDAQADYLLTGDKDLLVLRTFEKTQILTIAEFRKITL
jgi:predicted nucleic acid-binding protein